MTKTNIRGSIVQRDLLLSEICQKRLHTDLENTRNRYKFRSGYFKTLFLENLKFSNFTKNYWLNFEPPTHCVGIDNADIFEHVRHYISAHSIRRWPKISASGSFLILKLFWKNFSGIKFETEIQFRRAPPIHRRIYFVN